MVRTRATEIFASDGRKGGMTAETSLLGSLTTEGFATRRARTRAVTLAPGAGFSIVQAIGEPGAFATSAQVGADAVPPLTSTKCSTAELPIEPGANETLIFARGAVCAARGERNAPRANAKRRSLASGFFIVCFFVNGFAADFSEQNFPEVFPVGFTLGEVLFDALNRRADGGELMTPQDAENGAQAAHRRY